MKKRKNVILIAAAGVLLLLFAACNNPILLGDPDAGALVVRVGGNKSFSIKTIPVDVTSITVVLTNDQHPTLRDTAAYPDPGELVFANVKTGMWDVQVYLDNASGDTLYYGEGSVEILAGETAAATVVVFETGGDITIDIEEGVHAPTFSTVVDEVNQTIEVTILPHADVTAAGGFIKYTFGADPADPTFSDTTYTTPETIGFDEVIKAVAMLPPTGDDASEVAVYAYDLPYFTPNSVETDGFIEVTLNCEVPGSTLRYTINGGDPTYEYGIVAGNGTPIWLEEDPAVLKAVAYRSGDPDSVSDAVTTTYNLNLYATIAVKLDGITTVLDGDTGAVVSDFPPTAPDTTSDPYYFTIENNGADLDLELEDIYISGTNSNHFSLELIPSYNPIISVGEETAFNVYFTPTGTDYFDATQVEIISNNQGDDTFTIPIAGEGNSPPTITFLEGLYVQGTDDAAHLNLSGLYQVNGATTDEDRPVYEHIGGSYYLYYESYVYLPSYSPNHYYYDYFLGMNGGYYVDASTPSSYLYGNTYPANDSSSSAESGPTGESYSEEGDASADAWRTFTATGKSPYVSEVIDGLGGWPIYDGTLRVFYDFVDTDAGDNEGATIYKWYRSSDQISWELIPEGTSDTYAVQPAYDQGMYIRVEVTPVSDGGFLEGAPVETTYSIYIPYI